MNSETLRYSSYRWVVLGLAWLATVGVGWILYLTPALAYKLVPDLGLTPTQLTFIFTTPYLMAVFFNLPGGALGDRYGIRPVVTIGILLVGLSTLTRAWVSSFGEMLALACIFGIGFGVTFPNLAKLVAIWFPPREMGLANGIFMTALLVGVGVGLATAAYFGGWRTAFLYTGIASSILALVWFTFGRNSPKGTTKMDSPSITGGIREAARSKNIWLLGLTLFLLQGGYAGFSGNLPEALTAIRNVSPQEAGTITSLLTFAGIPGSILLPLLSDKVGLRKPFLYAGFVISAICLYFAWRLAPGVATYVFVIIGGITICAASPLLLTVPMECKEIGQVHVASAVGVASALGNAGGFLLPLFLVTPLMADGTSAAYNVGFLVTVLLLAAGAMVTTGLTETGARANAAREITQKVKTV